MSTQFGDGTYSDVTLTVQENDSDTTITVGVRWQTIVADAVIRQLAEGKELPLNDKGVRVGIIKSAVKA